jgi:hypothetical protein
MNIYSIYRIGQDRSCSVEVHKLVHILIFTKKFYNAKGSIGVQNNVYKFIKADLQYRIVILDMYSFVAPALGVLSLARASRKFQKAVFMNSVSSTIPYFDRFPAHLSSSLS